MRILYIDLDSQRPDHLGCYGYHRNTSPNIDRVAEKGVRFEHCYASDVPCLPSRSALWSGRCGFHNGVVNHGGTAAQPFADGSSRWVTDLLHQTGWMGALRRAGLKTVTVSTFAERHAAWHWYACYNEVYNSGKEGMDRADEVTPIALDWLKRNGERDNWFLHVNYWDPHIPYRTPLEFGHPFADDPLPAWLTEEVWKGSR
jgi:choline-sulfatase